MFDINDFLGYANATPSTAKTRKPVPATVRTAPKVQAFVSSFKSAPLPNAVAAVVPVRVRVDLPPVEVLQAPKPSLELVSYSPRSFAIFGDTKPMQATLDGLGGKFNRWLKRDGVATPGYIFSINRTDAVHKALGI